MKELDPAALEAAIRALLPEGWASAWGTESHDWMRARGYAVTAISAYLEALSTAPVALEDVFTIVRDDKGKFVLAPHTRLVEVFTEATKRGEDSIRLALLSAIHPAPSREAVIVQRIECVTFQNGYEEPADPIWRIEIGGICADFDTQTHAENFATAIRSLPSNAPSLGEARLAEGEAVAWRYLERGEWKYVGGLIKPQPGNSYPVEPLYSHPSHVQAEAGEAMKPTFGTPSGYVEVPPADLKGDEELARHWIDRYACGIDAEPQMNRIRAALNKGL